MRTPHGFIGLVAALVVASGCNYVIGLEDNTYDRPGGAGGATGPGGAGGGIDVGGASSSTGGAGGATPCQTIAHDGWTGGTCAGSDCAVFDSFKSPATTASTWNGLFVHPNSVDHMQVCPDEGYLRIRPQASTPGATSGIGLAWTGPERAGALYVDVGPSTFVAMAEVEPLDASTPYQGAGLSIYADDQHWMLFTQSTLDQMQEDGVQLFFYENEGGGGGSTVMAVQPAPGAVVDVNAKRILAVCRAVDGWYFYHGTNLASMERIEAFDDYPFLDNSEDILIGPTAHNFNNVSPFEAKVHRVRVVKDPGLDDLEACMDKLPSLNQQP